MKKIVVLLASLLFSCGSPVLAGTSASVSTTVGYNLLEKQNVAKVGLSLSAPLWLGFSWWCWTGMGHTAQSETWTSHTQALGFTYKQMTLEGAYRIGKDPQQFMKAKIPFDQEATFAMKIKLW